MKEGQEYCFQVLTNAMRLMTTRQCYHNVGGLVNKRKKYQVKVKKTNDLQTVCVLECKEVTME